MRILVFIGPSGSGKSSVARALHRRGLIAVTPSWTTRPRRPDEAEDTVEHRFVGEEEFDRLEVGGFFLETVAMFGVPYRYGLPPVPPPTGGEVPAIMVRAPLLPLVARHFPDRAVYQVEDSYERARERLWRRGPEADPGTRLTRYEEERAEGRGHACRVFVNGGSLDALVDDVAAAVGHDFAFQGSAP